MKQNKMKLFTIFITVVLLSLFIFNSSFVFAENEIMPIQEDPQAPTTTSTEIPAVTNNGTATPATPANPVEAKKNLKQGDVYLTGDNVTIDYVVDGNLFIAANTVTINSEIGGDAFILANTLTIGEQGYVFSNLFTIAAKLDVKGVVYDVYALSNDLKITGYVYRDVKALSTNNISILGTIGRNAFFYGTPNISLTDTTENSSLKGTISGNLNYISKSEVSIPEGVVGGKINYASEIPVDNDENQNIVIDYLFKLGSILGLLIIIWLLFLWLAPKFLNKTSNLLQTKPLPIISFGLLGLILIPIIVVVLLILNITASAAFLILILYFVLIAISSSTFIISISTLICEKLQKNKTIIQLAVLILTGIVFWAICLIPYLGGFISIIASVLGLGIILTNLIPLKTKSKKAVTEVK